MNKLQSIDVKEVKSKAFGSWLSILSQLAPHLHEAIKKSGEHVPCPIHGGEDGFRLHDDVESTGGGVCNTCGSFTDGIALLEWVNQWGFRETLEHVNTYLNGAVIPQLPKERVIKSESQPVKTDVVSPTQKWINATLSQSKQTPNPGLKAYLDNRGLGEVVDKLPSVIKAHDNLGYKYKNKKLAESPAIVAPITKGDDNKVVGLQRIYFTHQGHKLELEDGDGKPLTAKPMIGIFKGAMSGGAVKLEQASSKLHIGEGIETMLAVWHSVNEPAWACCTANLMKALEVPESVEEAVIWMDKDFNKAGRKAAIELGTRLHNQGVKVLYMEPSIEIPEGKKGVDWLDVYNEKGKADLKHELDHARDPKNAVEDIDLYPEAAIAKAVENLNRTYVHVIHKGKNFVIRTSSNSLGQKEYEMFPLHEFVASQSHKPPILIGWKTNGDPKYDNPGKVWLNNQNAVMAEYGMTFKPVTNQWVNVAGVKKLNMYFGLGVEPIKCTAKDIAPYLQHLRDNICSGNHTHFQYLLSWMAHLVQVPEEKPGVAIVVQGGQGTGKGSMLKPLGEIIGHHYFYAHNPETISGRFNSALENKMMIFADEAFFASKKATDTLKSMITEPIQTIERKGIDAIMTPSYCRIIMASNHTNVVHAEEDERRYFVLQVNEARKGDHDYWTKYNKWEESVPLAGMLLYYLLQRDISNYNPRVVPASDALTEQKLHSAEPPMRFLFEVLNNGCFVLGETWPARLAAAEITRYFKEYLDRESLKLHGDPSRILGRKLTKLGFAKKRANSQPAFYELPTLKEVREIFEESIKGKIDWDT